jgi:uncharacterized protein
MPLSSSHIGRFVFRYSIRLACLYAGILGLLMALERYLVFPAPSRDYGEWNAADFGAVESYVDSVEDGRVHVWTLKNPNAKSTLIFCHGNAETLGTLGNELAQIRDNWNVNVVAFDYRGYGKTGGVANQRRVLADAIAVGKSVQTSQEFQGQKLIAFGRSLGGAHAVAIASHLKTEGLILDRTFSSTVDVAASRYFFFPIRLVMANQFKSIDLIPNYQGALLQLHGKTDEVIPYFFGKKLFDACPSNQKQLVTLEKFYHNDRWPRVFWKAGAEMVQRLSQP